MGGSSLQHVRLREDLRKPPGDLAQLDAGAAAGRVLGDGQAQGVGVAPGGTMTYGVRADPHPEPLERFGGLLGPAPRLSRGDGVQDADGPRVAGERQQLQGGGDGFEVPDLAPGTE